MLNVPEALIISSSIIGAFTAFGVTITKIFDNKRKIHPTCMKYHEQFDNHIKENTDKLRLLDTVNTQILTFKERITKQEEKIDEMGDNINTQAIEIGKINTTLTHIEENLKKITDKLNC